MNILTEKLKEFGMTDSDLALVESTIQERVDTAVEAKVAELLESERQTFTEQADSVVESFAQKFEDYKPVLVEELQEQFATQLDEQAKAFEAEKNTIVESFATKLDAYSSSLIESLEEKYRASFEDEVQAIIESYETRLEQYSQYVTSSLQESYKSQDDLKVSMAEALIESVRSIYAEYNVVLPESVDFVSEYQEFVTESEAQITKLEEENKQLKRQSIIKEKQSILESVVSDMTVMQRENFESLCEAVVFVSADQYQSRLQGLKESFMAVKSDVEVAPVKEAPAVETKLTESKIDASRYAKVLGIK